MVNQMISGAGGRTELLAHAGHAGSGDLGQLAPLVLLALTGLAYGLGLRRLGGGSLRDGVARLGSSHVGSFVAAGAGLVVALLPSVEAAADRRFSIHMAQHMVLIAVVAPLLAWARPGLPFLLALPLRLRPAAGRFRRLARVLPDNPVSAVALHVVALWVWHLPAANRAAQSNVVVHGVEHVCLLGTAWLVWWQVARARPRPVGGPAGAAVLLGAALPSAALGAVLTFARTPLYPEQAAATVAAGADPLTDQQVAGLLMWGPADLVYFGVAFALLATWLRSGPATGQPAEPVLVAPGEVTR